MGAAVFNEVRADERGSQQTNGRGVHLIELEKGSGKERQRCMEQMKQSEKSNERLYSKFVTLDALPMACKPLH
jgi:hypothetical protein